MTTSYVAFGLELQASFPLPGMVSEEAPELPSLGLDLTSTEELEQAWGGSDGPPEWRGRLGDGLDLTIEREAAGDLLFAYGDRARFLLDATKRRLDCAPCHSGLDWQRVLLGKVIPAISLMRGYEGLHASAVDSPQGVVAIMGPSGSGKSTLAIELLRRGWPLFADDVLSLRDDDGIVRAHPGTPHMNLAEKLPAEIDPRGLGDTLGILSGERWLAAHSTTKRPGSVRMLCLLERAPDVPLQLHALTANPLALAPYMLGLSTDPERERSRFKLYADLIESATLMRLTAGSEYRPAELADLVEAALTRPPEPEPVAVAMAGVEPVAGGIA